MFHIYARPVEHFLTHVDQFFRVSNICSSLVEHFLLMLIFLGRGFDFRFSDF